MNYTKILIRLFYFELLSAYRCRAALLHSVFFYVAMVSLLPLAIGPLPDILAMIAPGIFWLIALLAIILGLEKLFKQDYLDGVFEQLSLSPCSLTVMLLVKLTANWVIVVLPLIVITPLLAMLFNLPWYVIKVLVISLLLGTPVLTMIASLAISLLLSLRTTSLLLLLLVLPLYVPVLIFATSAVDAALIGVGYHGQLAMLTALCLLSMSVVPWLISHILRFNS